MEIIKFMELFSDEQSCRKHFKETRMNQGVVCKQCGNTKQYWLSGKEQFQCSCCKFRTTLRSGTVMENSNLSFKIWYCALFLMTSTKKGISAVEMQRQLNHKRYETVWALMHKIRKMMGKRDSLYKLSDMIEFDEAHFIIETSDSEKRNNKQGKGSTRSINVAVMAESVPIEDIQEVEKGEHTEKKQCRYFKMKALDDFKAEEINEVVKNSVKDNSILFTDNSTSYVGIEHYVEEHLSEKSTPESSATNLKWVHIIISNAKRVFAGVYHKMQKKYLQNYLDEFVYKLNRRYMFNRLFERAMIAAVGYFRYNCG